MCLFSLSFAEVQKKFGVTYEEYFAAEDQKLEEFIADGIFERTAQGLEVTPLGRFFVRNVAMTFDTYLQRPKDKPVFSRTI